MRCGIKAIAALVLLSGCGSDANGADKAGNVGNAVGAASATTTATGAAQAVPPNAYVHPPVPAGFTLLSEAEVTDLLMRVRSVSRGGVLTSYNWSFEFNKGMALIYYGGGVAGFRSKYVPFRIYSDGQVCAPASAERTDYGSCFYLAKYDKDNKGIYILYNVLKFSHEHNGKNWSSAILDIKYQKN